MMRGSFGTNFRLTIFGESHGEAIGVVIDGVPAGTVIDEDAIALHMARRAPGGDPTATARREADRVEIVSGVFEGRAAGTPICGMIRNTNTRSGDYAALADRPRPGHADYAGHVKYAGFNDPRGGGHFSGRLTAPLVFAGSVARAILETRGVTIGAHIAQIADVTDSPLDPVRVAAGQLASFHGQRFPLLDPAKEAPMREAIALAKAEMDSVGGVIECAAVGVPAGIGSPFFGSVESVVSHLLFSVPAVKAVSFGAGEAFARMRGRAANDPMTMQDGRVVCTSNHNGGITGGITTGMPVVLRAAIKPTPSIAQAQRTVSLSGRCDAELVVHGRHDPCIVPRAVPVIESALAIALLDLWMDDQATKLV